MSCSKRAILLVVLAIVLVSGSMNATTATSKIERDVSEEEKAILALGLQPDLTGVLRSLVRQTGAVFDPEITCPTNTTTDK